MTHDPTKLADEPFAWAEGADWHKPAHRAVMASVKLGSWMSAALDDPAVCEAMKADIREWFSAGEPMEILCQALSLRRPTPPPDVAKADMIIEESRLDHITSALLLMAENIEEEGDRTYFGSTNDADQLLEIAQEMDAMRWEAALASQDAPPPSDAVERAKRAVIETFPWLTDGDAEIAARAAIAALQETKP